MLVYCIIVDEKSAIDTFNVNLFGAIDIVNTLLPLIKQSKQGRIILVSSQVGSWNHYCETDEIQNILDNHNKLTVQDVIDLGHDYIKSFKNQSKYQWSQPNNPAVLDYERSIYGTSKTLFSTYGRILARELKTSNIPVILTCPGMC